MLTLQAQEKQTVLDPVTVTATVNPIAASKTGRNLYVIKGEDIGKLPVHSVDELLRMLPGFEVQSRGPMGVQSDFVLRGGTFQQVLVIVDGLRVNDPNTGHFNTYIPVLPDEIERIEILKGASSAVYGSDAVGGVVNIITKAFANRTSSQSHVKAFATGGAYGLWNGGASGFYNKNKITISGGVQSNNADGQPQRGINGFFHLNSISGAVGYKLNEHWNLAYRINYDHRDFAAQNFYTTYVSDTAKEKVSTLWNQLQLKYAKGNNAFSINAGYKVVKDHYLYNKASTANDNRSTLLQALAQYTHDFSAGLHLIAGAQVQRKQIASNDRGDHVVTENAVFVVMNMQLSDAFSLSPAIRLDKDGSTGYQFIPQINASYKYNKFQFRASAGKTIRDADFTERYNNYNKAFVAAGSIGNPDLSPERSLGYEAGIDFFASKEWKIATTFFQRKQTDLIDWVNTPYAAMPRKQNLSPTGTYALAMNISEITTTGWETDILWIRQLQHKQTVSATAGFVWLSSVTNSGMESFYSSSHAKFLVNDMLSYATPRIHIAVTGLYKVRATPMQAKGITGEISKDYFVANIKVACFIIKEKLSVNLEADNVFNKTYADLLGSQMPGRWIMGGVKVGL